MIRPPGSVTISGGVVTRVDDDRGPKRLAYLGPVLSHVLEDDVLDEVVSVRVMLLHPSDDLDQLAKGRALLALKPLAREVLLGKLTTLIPGLLLTRRYESWRRGEKSVLGEVTTLWSSYDCYNRVLGVAGDHLLGDRIDIMCPGVINPREVVGLGVGVT
jgi:hypothetical protein